MPLQKKNVPIPLANLNAGETDPKLHQGLLRLENGAFELQGQIRKRKGVRALDGLHAENFAGIHDDKCFIYDEQVKIHDSRGLRDGGFDDIEPEIYKSGAGLVFRASYRAGLIDTKTEPIDFGSVRHLRNIETAEKGDVAAVVYTEDRQSGGTFGKFDLFLRTFNRNTGALVSEGSLSVGSAHCDSARLIDSGSNGLFCFYTREVAAAVSELMVRHIDAFGEIGAETVLSALDNVEITHPGGASTALRHFDCCAVDDASNHVICTYTSDTGAGPFLQVASVATSSLPPTVTGSTNIAGAGYHKSACFKHSTGNAVVAYFDKSVGQVRALVVDTVPSVAIGIVVVQTGILDECINIAGVTTALGNQFRVYYTIRDYFTSPLALPVVRRAHLSVAGGALVVDTSEDMLKGAYLAAKPFVSSPGYVHVPLAYRDYLEADSSTSSTADISGPTIFIARDDTAHGQSLLLNRHRFVGKILPGTSAHTYKEDGRTEWIGVSGSWTYEQAHVPAVFRVGDDKWVTAAAEYTIKQGTDAWMAISRAEISIASAAKTSEIAGLSCIPNSMPYHFDGYQISEQGFIHRPNNIYGVVVGGTGPAGRSGDYNYFAVYEWQDHAGNLHKSPPSNIITVTLAASDTAQIYIPPYILGQRIGVRAGLFRTESPTSSVFRRLATIDISSSLFAQFADDGVSGYQDFADPTVFGSQAESYVAGGELAADAPPPYRISEVWQRRLVVAPRSKEDSLLYYSKEIINGVPPEFSGFLTLPMTPTGGDITGLQALHDKLLIFKRGQVYATHGNGFTSTGAGANFTDPYLVSEAIGCANPKSILLTPMGVMFLADDGIYLVSKQLQVQPVGRMVKHYTDRHAITASLLVAKDSHAIFLTRDGPGLVYNYLYGQWATWTNHEAMDGVSDGTGLMFFKSATSNTMFVQDQTNGYDYMPAQTRIPMRIETSWIGAAGIGGCQRIYRALLTGENISKHKLNVKTAYDMVPTWVDSQDYDTAALRPFGTPEQYGEGLPQQFDENSHLLEIHTSRQKCTSIRYAFSDSESDTVFVVAAGDDGTVCGTEDGALWSGFGPDTVESVFSMWQAASNSVWAVTNGLVWHWDGHAWSSEDPDPNGYIDGAIFGFESDQIFAGGSAGDISRFDGQDWELHTTDNANAITGLWGTSPNSLYAVRESGVISKLDGVGWKTLNSGVSTDLRAIWGTGDDDIFVVGDGGVILHSEDAGATWEPQLSGVGTNLYGVSGADTNYVIAVGAGGVALRSLDGLVWNALASGTVEDLNAVTVKARDNATAVGNNGVIIGWDGAAWSAQASTVGVDLFAVAIADNTGRWSVSALSLLVGVKGGLRRLGPGRNL